MKTLQNNFTTVEQSKRLLELGVPRYSADCCGHILNGEYSRIYRRETDKELKNNFFTENEHILPCWSVGRLIELLVTCAIDEDYVKVIIKDIACYAAAVETYVNVITYLYKKKELDFSKLED